MAVEEWGFGFDLQEEWESGLFDQLCGADPDRPVLDASDKEEHITGRWKSAEDDLLRRAVASLIGTKWKWADVAEHVPGRNKKQCCERWKKHLCPGLNHSQFSEEEDDMLVQMVRIVGKKWACISSAFSNRTDNAIKNRWHANLKHKLDQSLLAGEPDPRFDSPKRVKRKRSAASPSTQRKRRRWPAVVVDDEHKSASRALFAPEPEPPKRSGLHVRVGTKAMLRPSATHSSLLCARTHHLPMHQSFATRLQEVNAALATA